MGTTVSSHPHPHDMRAHTKSPIRVEFVICGVSELINVVQAVVLHELGDQSPWGPSVRGHVFPVLVGMENNFSAPPKQK
jgi:hypothetical protein